MPFDDDDTDVDVQHEPTSSRHQPLGRAQLPGAFSTRPPRVDTVAIGKRANIREEHPQNQPTTNAIDCLLDFPDQLLGHVHRIPIQPDQLTFMGISSLVGRTGFLANLRLHIFSLVAATSQSDEDQVEQYIMASLQPSTHPRMKPLVNGSAVSVRSFAS